MQRGIRRRWRKAEAQATRVSWVLGYKTRTSRRRHYKARQGHRILKVFRGDQLSVRKQRAK